MSTEDYHAEIQELRAELDRLRNVTRLAPVPDDKPKPLRQSEVLRSLLERDKARAAGGEHDSVRLTRNAKGDTQIEVTVRTGDAEDVATIEAAAAKAQEVYDLLGRMYPMSTLDAPLRKDEAMPNTEDVTPVLHEWSIEVSLGTVRKTVFAATEDEATNIAMVELSHEMEDALYSGTWYVMDEGEVDMDEAALGADND